MLKIIKIIKKKYEVKLEQIECLSNRSIILSLKEHILTHTHTHTQTHNSISLTDNSIGNAFY